MSEGESGKAMLPHEASCSVTIVTMTSASGLSTAGSHQRTLGCRLVTTAAGRDAN